MDVWIGVLAFVLFLGFSVAMLMCVATIKRQTGIIVKSRIHRKTNISEVLYANAGLLILTVLVYLKYYLFVPAVIAFVAFILVSTRVKSGLTEEGAIIGPSFIEWEFMQSYKLVDEEEDSNIIILKIRANRKQYVMVCNRRDKDFIRELFAKNKVKVTETVSKE